MKAAETLEYGGKTYRTVKIGTQIWMAENLNYAGPNGDIGRYYDNDPANGEKYGRLYTWNEAMEVCPPGWHLPSAREWLTLADFAGGEKIAGMKLKAKSGWNEKGNGTDDYGFSALPGGRGFSDGSFSCAGGHGNWYCTGELIDTKDDDRFRLIFTIDEDVELCINLRYSLLSVRCVKD